MTSLLPHWLHVLLELIGACSLLFSMGLFAFAAFAIASSETARRRKERRADLVAADAECAQRSLEFLEQYAEEFRAYGVELRPGARVQRVLGEAPATDKRVEFHTIDELMPHVSEVPE